MKSLCLLLTAVLFWHCSDEKKDVTTDIDKNGSVEVLVATSNTPDYTLLTTTEKVWVRGQLVKTLIKTDTIPSLGLETTDDEGNSVAPRLREYEFFITVK
ncbi:MAG: hypothetical protein ACKOCH_03100 [Bacteroidota bacterium]